MSNLIDQAKKIAAENLAAKQREQEAERANYASLQAVAEALWEEIRPELEKLQGVANVRGKFHLQPVEHHHDGIRAFLWADGSNPESPSGPVAWIKARVFSGTVKYSDDSPEEDYTAAALTVRVYPPNRSYRYNTDPWDTADREYYHNGGSTMSIRDPKDMVKMLAFLAEHLAPWVA